MSLQESSSQYSGQTTSNNTQMAYGQTASRNASYRTDDVSYSGSEYYSEGVDQRRPRSDSDTRPFDRQYPYNLSTENPIETLSRPKPINTMTEDDYARARLLREAEELRARAYGGGGSVVSGTNEYPRSYPHQHQQQYRNDGEDDYTVDSRASRGSQGSRSQYSYDRHPQQGHSQGHAYQGQYAQNEQAVYTTTSHTAVHRAVPVPHHAQPYAVQHPQGVAGYYTDRKDPSPMQYRVEDGEYDSNSDEGKDDFDHRQAYVRQGNKNSRSSNFTSTSSISAADEGEYTPRSTEGSFKTNYDQFGNHAPGQSPNRIVSPGGRSGEGAQYGSTTSIQYTTTTTSRAPAPPPSHGAHLARSASPAPNNPLVRVPSFITPRTRSPSPAPMAGGPVPTLARVPSFRPPVAPAQVTPRVGIAGEAGVSTSVTTTVATEANVRSTTSVDGSVNSSSDPSLPQFERRKTLMRLVSKLTVDSDED